MSSSSVFTRTSVVAAFGALLSLAAALALAADPVTPQSNPEQFDRDGKHICGYNIMTDSERAGYRSMMHNNKELVDRDNIRTEHCKAMRKRAQDKGVPFEE